MVGTASGPGFFAAVISSVFTNANRSSVLSPTSTPLFPAAVVGSVAAFGAELFKDWTTVTEHQRAMPNSDLVSASYSLQ